MPFLIGCLIIPLLFALRRSLAETDEFLAREQRPTGAQIVRILLANWSIVLVGLMMVTMTTVSFYLITAYTPTFGASVLHLTALAGSPDGHILCRPFKFYLASRHGCPF